MSAKLLSTASEEVELVMIEETGGPTHRVEYARKVRIYHQMRALFLKDLTLRRRAYGTTLCQILVPVVLLGLAGLLQLIANVILADFKPTIPGTDRPSFPQDASQMISCGIDQSTSQPTGCIVESFNLIFYIENNPERIKDVIEYFSWVPYDLYTHKDSSCNFDDINIIDFITSLSSNLTLQPQFNLYNIPMVYYVNNTHQDLGSLLPNGSSSGFLGKAVPPPKQYSFTRNFTINPEWTDVCFPDDADYDEDSLSLPFFTPLNSARQLQDYLVDTSNEYISLAGGSTQLDDQFSRNYEAFPYNQDTYDEVLSWIQEEKGENYTFTKVKPYAGVVFDQLSDTSLQYTLVVPELLLYDNFADLHCGNYTNNESDPCASLFIGLLANSEVPRTQSLVNLLHNAFLKNMTNNNNEGDTMIEVFLTALPSLKIELQVDVATVMASILYPFATSFLLPVFITSLVYDKREKHLIMMLQNGLTRPVYWMITYCFDYFFYIVIMVIVTALSLLIRIRLFTQTNALILLVVFFFWGHALVVLGFFLSNVFQRPRTATVVGYLLIIVGAMVSALLEGLNIFGVDKTPPFFYMLYPPFAYYRLLGYMNNACTEYQCFGIDHFGWGNTQAALYSDAVLYLVFGILLFWLLFLYLSYIFPGEFGVRKPFHFPITDLIKCTTGRDITKCNHGNNKHQQLPSLTATNSQSEDITLQHKDDSDEVDEDVQAEADTVADNFTETSAPIVMHQLRKEFPASAGKPPHIAVHGFSLSIQRNECFGLLGPNGAGKTTLISLLTGLYEPTNGTARIAGYDLATEMSSVHQHIGVCPQFDIQHASLTAKEHLLFYGRLRGLKWSHEKTVVENALRQVNLLDAANKKSKQLSGGMRRRLSVAMACVGSPDILILDEPTTGLDPSSRRQVWDVINNVKQNKSVILTTHAMEEADQLCTRIGIMNYGKLRCLGSQNRLKTKYGIGYQLQLNCIPRKIEEVEAFVRTGLPNAVHLETYNGKISYKIDKDQLVVSELFSLLDSVKMQLGISDWGIKRTTLEDVFLTIVAKHHDQRTPMHRRNGLSWLPCKKCLQPAD